MIKIKFNKDNPQKTIDELSQNVMVNPIILRETPTSASEVKSGTIATVKDATDYIYLRTADGKLARLVIDAII